MSLKYLQSSRKLGVSPEIIERLKSVLGEENVSTDWTEIFMYARSLAWPFLMKYPDVVVRPHTPMDVAQILRIANREKIPVVAKGGIGEGASVPLEGGILIDLTTLNKIDIHPEDKVVVVEAGASWHQMLAELRKYDLTVPIWPTYESAAVASAAFVNPSHGYGSTRYGVVADLCIGVEVAFPNGELLRTGALANEETEFGVFYRYPNGPEFTGLFTQIESNLGVITRLAFKTIDFKKEWLACQYFTFRRDQIDECGKAIFSLVRHEIFDVHFNDRWWVLPAIWEGVVKEMPEDAWFHISIINFGRTDAELRAQEEICRMVMNKYGGKENIEAAERLVGPTRWTPTYEKSNTEPWPAWNLVGHDSWGSRNTRNSGMWLTTSQHFPYRFFKEVYEHHEKIAKEVGIWNERYLPWHDSFACRDSFKTETFVMYNPYDPEDLSKVGEYYIKFFPKIVKMGASFHGLTIQFHGREAMEKLGPLYEWMKKLRDQIDPNHIMNPGTLF